MYDILSRKCRFNFKGRWSLKIISGSTHVHVVLICAVSDYIDERTERISEISLKQKIE